MLVAVSIAGVLVGRAAPHGLSAGNCLAGAVLVRMGPQGQKEPKARPLRLDFLGDPLPDGAAMRLGTVRWQPGCRVWALSFAPDGKTLATAGEDGNTRVWEVATGKELLVLPCHEHVHAVAFVADGAGKPGRWLATGGDDTLVRLWDLATGKLRVAWAHAEPARSLAASADGKYLAVGAGRAIALWDVAAGKKLRQWAAHAGGVLSLAFTPDGKGLLSGGRADKPISGGLRLQSEPPPDDYALALWDPGSGKLRHKFAEPNTEAHVLGFSADGKTWASAGFGKGGQCFVLFDADGRPQQTVPCAGLEHSLGAFAYSPDGRTLAAAGGRAVYTWSAATGKRLSALQRHADYLPIALAFSPDGETLAAAACLDPVILWDLRTGKPRHDFAAHGRAIITVAVAPDCKKAVTGGYEGDLREWDLQSGKTLRHWTHPDVKNPYVACARYTPDGKTLACSYFGGVSLWDVPAGKQVRNIPAALGEGRITSLAFSPDGGKLVWQSIDHGDLPLWDVKSGKEIRRLPQGTGGTYFLAYSPTEDVIASVVTGSLTLWDAATGKARYNKPLSGHYLTFSSDGLALALYAEPLVLLDAATGAEWARIPWRSNHGGYWGLAFSPDGRYVAVTEGNNVGIWDVLAGQYVHTFVGHRSDTTSLAFTPDGRWLVSGSYDATALVWDMAAVPQVKLPPREGAALWDDLRKMDSLAAYAALCRLRLDPKLAQAVLDKHLQAVAPADAARVEKLLQELDAPKSAAREAATVELARLADQVEGILRERHQKTTSPEVRERLGRILAGTGKSPETRRQLWALRLLEEMRTPEALALLDRLAKGAPAALVTRRAQEVRARLARG
jgi:WD40 repeat protein